jgi:hypothetical protein
VGIEVCSNHGPWWSDGTTIRKAIFTCVYIGKSILKIVFSITIEPEKLFT